KITNRARGSPKQISPTVRDTRPRRWGPSWVCRARMSEGGPIPVQGMSRPRAAGGRRQRLAGRLVLPGEEEYDAARQVWHASHDYRPALIAQPLSVADVQAAVRFAGEWGLPVCVRGGGHNHAGWAVADGALMLDLSAMVSVRVAPARRVATVGGGATWRLVDQATQDAGLAVTGANVSAVGAARPPPPRRPPPPPPPFRPPL